STCPPRRSGCGERSGRRTSSAERTSRSFSVRVSTTVNGTPREHDVQDRTLLVNYLRDACGLTGTNTGCDTTSCGACTVLLDGESVKSCTVLAAQADGREVTTIEGL